jgi:hypothetical protein
VAGLGLGLTTVRSADVTLLALGKGVDYVQASDAAPTLLADSPYYFFAQVRETTPGAVTNAALVKPAGTILPLTREEAGLAFEQGFTGQSALNSAFPSSSSAAYRLDITGTNDGAQTVPLYLKSASFPNAPRLQNYTAAQAVDAAQAFTLTWTAFQNATTNDVVLVQLTTAFGAAFATGLPGEANALNGKATSVTLPAGTLEPGRIYQLSLFFLRVVDVNRTAYAEAVAYAVYSAANETTVKTTGSAPWPQSASFRFHFLHETAVLPKVSTSGTKTAVFCSPLATRFNLHFIVVDPNPRPESVVFNGPAESGISRLASFGYWDFLGPTTRLYFTPELGTPPYPPGGVYQVDYRGLNFAFRPPDPEAQNRQIRVRPEITVSAGNFSQVNWVYEDLRGNPIAAPPQFASLTLRLESDTAQLFHEDNLPLEPRSKKLPAAIAWNSLRNVTFILVDDQENLYLSPSRKLDFPVITTLALPDALRGKPYSVPVSAGGGNPPYTWSSLPTDPLPTWLALSSGGLLSGTPPLTGEYWFTLRVADAIGQVADRVYMLTVTAPSPTNYTLWCEDRFASNEFTNPAVSGRLSDPDSDGRVNLLEYAVGSAPKQPETSGVLAIRLEPDRLAVTHSLNSLATDIAVNVQVATQPAGPAAWQDLEDLLAPDQFSRQVGPPDSAGRCPCEVVLPRPLAQAALFLRLQVRELTP